jgi:hypothetical protein
VGRRNRNRRGRPSSNKPRPATIASGVSAKASRVTHSRHIGKRTVFKWALLAIVLLVGILLVTDRPLQGSDYEAEKVQTEEEASRIDMWDFYDSLTVGLSKSTDFGADAEFEHPRIEFSRFSSWRMGREAIHNCYSCRTTRHHYSGSP